MIDEIRGGFPMEGSRQGDDSSAEEGSPFEEVWKIVGGFGRWQRLNLLVACLSGIFFAFSALSGAFLAASPDHWCKPGNLGENHSHFEFSSVSSTNGSVLNSVIKECSYYDTDYDQLLEAWSIQNASAINISSAVELKCHSWVYDNKEFYTTIVTEWDLVCENKWLMTISQSLFMFGILIGGIGFGQLSDMFGRRFVSLICCILYMITSFSIAFTYNYLSFITLRFMSACVLMGVFLPHFVLFMECSGPKSRSILGVIFQVSFSIGALILSLLAYFFRRWRHLQLATSVPSLVMLSYFWLIPESPHWLLLHGRLSEAVEILAKIAKGNQKEVNRRDIECVFQPPKDGAANIYGFSKRIFQFFMNQWILVKTPVMRRRSLLMFCQWFVVAMVFYGISFNSVNLDSSVHQLTAISALFEAASLIICGWTVDKFGRRLILMSLFFLCGISSLAILFVPKAMVWFNLALSIIGKISNGSAFAVLFIYSPELAPTQVRNIALGAASMWARIGAMIAPFIVDMLGDIHYAIPSTAFGILSLVAGFLTLLLPEIGNQKLPDSIKEVELMSR